MRYIRTLAVALLAVFLTVMLGNSASALPTTPTPAPTPSITRTPPTAQGANAAPGQAGIVDVSQRAADHFAVVFEYQAQSAVTQNANLQKAYNDGAVACSWAFRGH